MKQIPDIGKKVEQTLESLDGIQRAEASPYFFTRLKARLSKEDKEWGGIAGVISRPVYALAMICVILMVNVWIAMDNEQDDPSIQASDIQASIDQMPDEYNVAVTSLYNYEAP
jgi:hypothetical protein